MACEPLGTAGESPRYGVRSTRPDGGPDTVVDPLVIDWEQRHVNALASGDFWAAATEAFGLSEVCLMYAERSTFALDEFGGRCYFDDPAGDLERRVEGLASVNESLSTVLATSCGAVGHWSSPAVVGLLSAAKTLVDRELSVTCDFDKITTLLESVVRALEAEAERLTSEADADDAPADDPRRIQAAECRSAATIVRSVIRVSRKPQRPTLPRSRCRAHAPPPRHVRPALSAHAPPSPSVKRWRLKRAPLR